VLLGFEEAMMLFDILSAITTVVVVGFAIGAFYASRRSSHGWKQ